MSTILELLPETSLGVLFVLLSTARFENQRWIRARSAGLQGSNQTIGAFVDITGALSRIFVIAFVVAYAVDATILEAVVLAALTFAVTIYSFASSWVFGGDNPIVWTVGTIAIWPLIFMLASRVTWFGLL